MEKGARPRQDEGVNGAEFIAENTRLLAPSLVPEIFLHLADEALPLWQKTEDALAQSGLAPPFWAFAWAGGQALARHVLDNPHLVAGKSVLDVGAGSGLVAIAAALAGARTVRASEVDDLAIVAIGLNAAQNGVTVETEARDLLTGDPDADIVFLGDVFYERALADRAIGFAVRAADIGATVLIGDPSRSYLPQDALQPVATYAVPTPRALEDADVKKTTVWTLRPNRLVAV